MAIYGFQGELARPLVQVARERLSRPHIATGVKIRDHKGAASRGYIVQPIDTIPAATKDVDGKITLSSGECYVLELNEDDELIYQVRDGDRVTQEVYNLCPEAFGPGGDDLGSDAGGCSETVIGFTTTNLAGNLCVTERCVFPCESSSSSAGSESESSGSGPCITCFDGVCADDIPIVEDADDVEYVLGKKSDGCMVWVPVVDCGDLGSGSGSA